MIIEIKDVWIEFLNRIKPNLQVAINDTIRIAKDEIALKLLSMNSKLSIVTNFVNKLF